MEGNVHNKQTERKTSENVKYYCLRVTEAKRLNLTKYEKYCL